MIMLIRGQMIDVDGWFSDGSAYVNSPRGRVLLADRENPNTGGWERDRFVDLAAMAPRLAASLIELLEAMNRGDTNEIELARRDSEILISRLRREF